MYVRKIYIENYGAIPKMDYTMRFDENNNPIPLIIVGKNGTGKTLVLSNILHSLIELKRKFYPKLLEVSGDSYYRICSKKYIKHNENFSYLRTEFDNAHTMDLMIKDYDSFTTQINADIHKNVMLNNENLKKDGFYSDIKKPESNVFTKNIYLYFPVDRYYIPTWENSENEKLSFVTDGNDIIGRANSSIVQYNLLEKLETWLLDVIIDKLLYECNIQKYGSEYTQVYEGKNTNIQYAINSILLKILGNETYTSVRIGISTKYHRRISVLGRMIDGREVEIVPKFSNLSSGQIMILGIFSSIIRAYDEIYNSQTIDFNVISGVVVIDEIDAHLHSDLLKNVLPELISMFPKIQFIISSHSPFFLLGMRDKFKDACDFVAMPTGTILDNIEKFDELRNCYSIIDESYQNILKIKEQYEDQVNTLSKPLIVTEGKTDWMHLKNALNKLKSFGKFSDLDVRFLEYNYEFSDSKLKTLLEQLSRVPNPNKIIGVFDSDSSMGQAYSKVENFGNNVYGCCITDTQGYNCGISIELLYSRKDLTLEAEDKRRIYLSDEFTEKSRQLKADSTIVCHNGTLIDAFRRNIIKIVDSEVFDSNENSLALSKANFAERILNQTPPFDTISVEGFTSIFKIISDIILDVYK